MGYLKDRWKKSIGMLKILKLIDDKQLLLRYEEDVGLTVWKG